MNNTRNKQNKKGKIIHMDTSIVNTLFNKEDKVTIKEDCKNINPFIDELGYNEQMDIYLGKKCTISNITRGYVYRIEGFMWLADCFQASLNKDFLNDISKMKYKYPLLFSFLNAITPFEYAQNCIYLFNKDLIIYKKNPNGYILYRTILDVSESAANYYKDIFEEYEGNFIL